MSKLSLCRYVAFNQQMLCKTTFTPEGIIQKMTHLPLLPSLESCSKEQLLNKKNCVMFLRDHALQTSTPYCHFFVFLFVLFVSGSFVLLLLGLCSSTCWGLVKSCVLQRA